MTNERAIKKLSTLKMIAVNAGTETAEAMDMAIELLKKREAKPPVHVHDEYPEHDWVRKENGEIDDFACSGGDHNGPFCKRCYYTFCIFCKPNGWNDQPCVVDKYKCPGCGKDVVKGTKFCSKCGQEMEWDG